MAEVSPILKKLSLSSLVRMGKDAAKINGFEMNTKKDNFEEKISPDIMGYSNL